MYRNVTPQARALRNLLVGWPLDHDAFLLPKKLLFNGTLCLEHIYKTCVFLLRLKDHDSGKNLGYYRSLMQKLHFSEKSLLTVNCTMLLFLGCLLKLENWNIYHWIMYIPWNKYVCIYYLPKHPTKRKVQHNNNHVPVLSVYLNWLLKKIEVSFF